MLFHSHEVFLLLAKLECVQDAAVAARKAQELHGHRDISGFRNNDLLSAVIAIYAICE